MAPSHSIGRPGAAPLILSDRQALCTWLYEIDDEL